MRLRTVLKALGLLALSVLLVFAVLLAWQLGLFRPRPAKHPIAAETRDDRWLQDVDYLGSQLPRLHYDLSAAVPLHEFQSAVDALRDSVSLLSDEQIHLRLARVIAGVNDGHTFLAGWTDEHNVAPIRLRTFSDGIFVVAAGEGHENLLEARVLGVGETPVDEVTRALSELISADNIPYLRARSARMLRNVSVLSDLGFATAPDTVVYRVVVAPGDTLDVALPAKANGETNWVEAASEGIPLYRTRSDESHWYEVLPGGRTLFFKYNRCRERKAFKQLANEMKELIEAGDIERMIVDFRGNGGGTSIIFDWYLLRFLKRNDTLNGDGRLYSAIDIGTFSSAVLNSIALERTTGATTVGEPTGGKPNHFGEVKSFTLPNSGLVVGYSTKYFEAYPELGDAPYFEPEMHLPLSSEDYFAGHDPVLEWILNEDTR